jgi:hypothetical protein
MMIVQSMAELQQHGVTRSMVANAVRAERWSRLTHDTYLLAPKASEEQIWLATLDLLICRGAPPKGASHRSAAIIHGFDGFANPGEFARIDDAWPIDVAAPMTSSADRKVIRTRRPFALTNHNSLCVTTIAQTLLDLGHLISRDLLELAVESALRGPDPTDPYTWNQHLYAELEDLLANTTDCRGRRALRQVLAQRPSGAMPTGSLAETVALQGFRSHGLGGLLRQPEIQVLDLKGRIRHTFYPDFADLLRGLLIEIDGIAAHSGEKPLQRDDRRQNLLQSVFRVVRYRAAVVLNDPSKVGLQAKMVWDELALPGSPAADAYQARIRLTPRGCQIRLNL